jgi:GNAT superfamily N-acetyltransferase
LAAAAELMAATHGRAQSAGPAGLVLGLRFLAPSGCRGILEQLVVSERTRAVVAEVDGRVCGYLAGERQLFAPEDFASIYAEPRSTNIPLHGHAVAAEADASVLYESMYAVLAEKWVADGFFVHAVAVRALDRAATEAWANLGFARKSICAVRPTRKLTETASVPTGLAIEEVRDRDDEVFEDFHRRLMTFQTGTPMFWPYNGESDAKVNAVRRDALRSGQSLAFIARDAAGEAVGSLLFVPSVFLSPLLVCDKMVYLWEGYVSDEARGTGVGTLLLDHAMQVLQKKDIQWCALHYIAGNPRGGRFWPVRGFLPVEYVLRRQVDERVAWAKGFPE